MLLHSFKYLLLCSVFSLLGNSYAYSVSGNRILDRLGNPMYFRGVSISTPEYDSCGFGQYDHAFGPSDWDNIKSWGTNVIRIPITQCCWLSSAQSSNYKNFINDSICSITSKGMGVILDLHGASAGVAGSSNCQIRGGDNMPDSESVTFWTQVSSQFGNIDGVIFEVFNEPALSSNDFGIWKNGGSAGSYTTVGMQALVNAVRANSNNLIIVGGLDYAYDLSGLTNTANRISGSNIVYNSHPYKRTNSGSYTRDPSDWDRAFGYLASTFPVVSTEFGTDSQSPPSSTNCDSDYVQDFIDYAQTKGIGFTGWAWVTVGDGSKTYCQYPLLINDYSGTPSPYGTIIKASISANPQIGAGPAGCGSVTTTSTTGTTTTTGAATTGTTTTGTTTTGTTTTCSNQLYDACGGSGVPASTPTCCPAGSYCNCSTQYYHQCLPGNSNSPGACPSSTSTTSGSVPSTSTTGSTPSTSTTTGDSCAPLYGQCGGGNDWTGPTCCSTGTCTVQYHPTTGVVNQYYKQCL